MSIAAFVSKKAAVVIFIFTVANVIFYFSLCLSSDLLFGLLKTGLWHIVFELCKETILLFQVLVGYVAGVFLVLTE